MFYFFLNKNVLFLGCKNVFVLWYESLRDCLISLAQESRGLKFSSLYKLGPFKNEISLRKTKLNHDGNKNSRKLNDI